MPKRIVIAISGASGSIYAKVLLDQLLQCQNQFETVSIVASDNATDVAKWELGSEFLSQYPFKQYAKMDFMAPFASGSAGYTDMIIIPCSMGIMGRIASGISNDLMTRAADVMLKERRKLVLAIRESPYNLIHIQNMQTVTQAGGIIVPCSPSFYSQPTSFEDLAKTVTSRILDLIGIQVPTYRWNITDFNAD